MSIGVIAKTTDAAVALHQILKTGSDANHVAVCGAADVPLYIALQAAAGAGVVINVQELGTNRPVAAQMLSAAGISVGAFLEPASLGRCATLGGGIGTHQVCGWALTATTGADQVLQVVTQRWLFVV